MREYLLNRVMIGHMQLKICLIFDILHKIFKLSLTKFFVHRQFLIFFIDMLLIIPFDDLSKLGNQLKHANFKKTIQKVRIAFEESNN
jgi:hypothetical protein